MDWLEFYLSLLESFESLIGDVTTQFGTEQRPFVLAQLLPERVRGDVLGLTFEETVIGFSSTPALDNTRYSPVQFGQSGMEVTDIAVTMGHTDIGSRFTSRDHDGVVMMLQQNQTMQAATVAVNWATRTLLEPHLQKNEIQRAQALLLGAVSRKGINGFTETVSMQVASGFRPEIPGGTVAAPAGWFDPDYEIISDLIAGQQALAMAGFSVNRIITDSEALTLMKRNSTLAALRGSATDATVAGLSNAALNAALNDYELPGVESYDNGWKYPLANGTQKYRKYMQPSDTHLYVLMAGTTERSEDIVATGGELVTTLESTLGYYAIGRNPGQVASGRTVTTKVMELKPVGLHGESYQTGFPVLGAGDAVYVLRIKRPTP